MSPLTLAEKILAVDRALDAVPHAFGGAIALAYYAEPRATIDIDLNVFLPGARYEEVASPLRRLGVVVDDPGMAELAREAGQLRVWWEQTPLDLFFAYDRFHDAAARARRTVEFADATIPILAPEHLVVCKTVFNRGRDWVDIDAMCAIDVQVDAAEVLRWVGRIVGDDDPRYERIVAVLTR